VSRDALPFPLPVAAVDAIIEPEEGNELPPRQCGRCRMMFDGDPTLDASVRNGWALCPACDAILLPARAGRTNVIDFRGPTVMTAEHPAGER
jgi:hypothetical protein